MLWKNNVILFCPYCLDQIEIIMSIFQYFLRRTLCEEGYLCGTQNSCLSAVFQIGH